MVLILRQVVVMLTREVARVGTIWKQVRGSDQKDIMQSDSWGWVGMVVGWWGGGWKGVGKVVTVCSEWWGW